MVLPLVPGVGVHRARVEGFTIPGMRQQQHFCKHTKKSKKQALGVEVEPGAFVLDREASAALSLRLLGWVKGWSFE